MGAVYTQFVPPQMQLGSGLSPLLVLVIVLLEVQSSLQLSESGFYYILCHSQLSLSPYQSSHSFSRCVFLRRDLCMHSASLRQETL